MQARHGTEWGLCQWSTVLGCFYDCSKVACPRLSKSTARPVLTLLNWMTCRWRPDDQVLPVFDTPEYEQAISQPPSSGCSGIHSMDHDCSEFFLRPKLRLCNGTLSALFIWLVEGDVEQLPGVTTEIMQFASSTIRRVSSTPGRHLVVLGGGLHGGRLTFHASAYLHAYTACSAHTTSFIRAALRSVLQRSTGNGISGRCWTQ